MTPAAVFLLVVAAIAGAGLALLILEARTLTDRVEGNHITAAVCVMTRDHPGLVVLLWGLLNFMVGAVAGHIWSAW